MKNVKKFHIISYGSLYGNITIDDILAGLSTTRNPYLQSILMRLKLVENKILIKVGNGLSTRYEKY